VTLRVTKMHGLGNDYVYVDTFHHHVTDPARLARAVSDRHTGLGGDGLILIGPAEGEEAHLRMRIFNADGGEAQMCGNGIRCVARYAVERGLSTANPLHVQTGRGTLKVTWDGDGDDFMATVDMGEPVLEAGALPAALPGVADRERVQGWPIPPEAMPAEEHGAWMRASGFDGRMTLVGMGNPHAVLWCRHVDAVPLESVGPWLERHPWFPQRINVHAAQTESGGLAMRTWERGSGITMACGTGACAVAVAAVLGGTCGSPVRVRLPGGHLRIAWDGPGHGVRMTGPATFVADAELGEALSKEAG
jgi:diaminopimelate epimerase